jgi:3-oxosteroid 1-dehydrogenase
MSSAPGPWSLESDVVVIGSGGAGLSAAVAAARSGVKTLVLERASGVGGSTLFSGALAWLPNNHLMAAKGISDSRQEVLAYMHACMPGRNDQTRWEAFVDAAPETVRFLQAHTPLRFKLTPAPDSFAEKKGGKTIGRNLEPLPLNPALLGDWQSLLLDSPFPILPITLGEAYTFAMRSTNRWTTLIQKIKLGPRVIQRYVTGRQTMGVALITGLLKGCQDAGVQVLINVRAKKLIKENHAVLGVTAEIEGRETRIKAERAVILATGGYEWNPELVRQYLPGPVEYPLTTPYAQGDGQIMAQDAGAVLAHMNEVMMWTAARVPGQKLYHGSDMGRLVNPIVNNPHSIIVNRQGKRFVNEASHNAPQAYHHWDKDSKTYPNLQIWSIFDAQFRRKFTEPSLGLFPKKPDPDWLIKDDSLFGLAQKTGIDPQGLVRTIARFNKYARRGKDLEFNRGEFCYDRHFVPNIRGNPNLGDISKPPFFAIRLYASTVGTKGGPLTNQNWQVIDPAGNEIKNLYAVGTCAATIIGPVTISSSSAVGLVLTQGFIAGRHASGA